MARSRVAKPADTIRERLAQCRAQLAKHKVSAYLITNRVDQIYLTGFDGEDGAVIITPRDVHIITDGRFEEAIRNQAPWAKRTIRNGLLTPAIAETCSKLRLRQVHFQADHVSVELCSTLQKSCNSTKLKPARPIVNRMRLLKDAAELKKIKRAIDIAESAFTALKKKIKVGMTEAQVAALLEFEMKSRGALEPSFPTIAAEGPNAALPHAHPGSRKLRKGSLLLVDWGARWEYYCSDLTRCLFIGKILPRLRKVYQIVLEAQQRAIEAVAPGKRVCDIDKVARDYIADAGYGDRFGHGLGHGVGLDIHEAPRLKFGFDDKLEPGMVVTIEPGIYLPGIGGVRIEDDVLVTLRGHEVLTHLPKSIESAVI